VVDLYACNGTKAQQWHLVPAGTGISLVNPGSGLCLADPGDATAEGTQLVINTCSPGDPGISWQASSPAPTGPAAPGSAMSYSTISQNRARPVLRRRVSRFRSTRRAGQFGANRVSDRNSGQ
jgi:hypothetical protein